MTITEDSITTTDDLYTAVEQVSPLLQERASAIEATRTLPPDVVDALRRAGCLHMLLPAGHGGVGADLVDALDVTERLARAEPSAAWLAMLSSAAWVDVAGVPPDTFDGLVGRDQTVFGVFSPSGSAEAVDGGYRVSGRWPFASGCELATWIYGNCLDQSGDDPTIRTVVFRVDEVEIEDTWHVLGLRGSGSHHMRVDNIVVPAERTCTENDPRAIDTPLLMVPPPSLIALGVATVALGAARGALDELRGVAGERTPLLASNPLAGHPLYQRDLAAADTELRAAHDLIRERADDLWATASGGGPITLDQRTRTRAACAWVGERALDAVRGAFRSGGGSAVYDTSPLQRRLRDVETIGQHFLLRPDTMVTAGRAMSGQELDVPVF